MDQVPRKKSSLGTVLHGPEENICPWDRAPRSRGDNLPSGPCFMVPRRKFALRSLLHGPKEIQKKLYNNASRWTGDLWLKSISLTFAYFQVFLGFCFFNKFLHFFLFWGLGIFEKFMYLWFQETSGRRAYHLLCCYFNDICV